MDVKWKMMKNWWCSQALLTKSLFGLCSLVYVVGGILAVSSNHSHHLQFCLSNTHPTLSAAVLHTVSHADFLHLAFNMIAMFSVLPNIETRLGSGASAFVVGLLSFLTTLSHLLLGWSFPHFLASCVLGFSGVLFGLFSVESYQMPPGTKVSLCGLRSVDIRAAPWIMFLLSFALFPSSSTTGHLAGILWGIVLSLSIKDSTWRKLSDWAARHETISKLEGFCPGNFSLLPGGGSGASGGRDICNSSTCVVENGVLRSSPTSGQFPPLPIVASPGALKPYAPFAGEGRKLGGRDDKQPSTYGGASAHESAVSAAAGASSTGCHSRSGSATNSNHTSQPSS